MPLSKKQREKRKQTRVELDFKPEVKQMFKDMSDELGCPMSQLIQFYALVGLDKGQQLLPHYLEPARSPAWQQIINFDRLFKDLKG